MTNSEKNTEKENRTRSQVYVLAIQIIFSVVIAVSFTDYHAELVPFIFDFQAIMILVAYTTVLASLIGYTLTMNYRPHRNINRFIIDVWLLYLYFQLIYSPKHDLEIFFSIFPIIFGSYLIWGILEHYEYKNNVEYSKVPFWKRIFNFSVCLVLTFSIWAFYSIYFSETITQPYENASFIEWILLFSELAIVLGFRVYSWITGRIHGLHGSNF